MTTPEQYADLLRHLAAVGAATASLAARLDRMEQREQQLVALVRDLHQEQIGQLLNAAQP